MEYLIVTVAVVLWCCTRTKLGCGFVTLGLMTKLLEWCAENWATMTAEPSAALLMELSARSIFKWIILSGAMAEKRMWRSVYGKKDVKVPTILQLYASELMMKSMMVSFNHTKFPIILWVFVLLNYLLRNQFFFEFHKILWFKYFHSFYMYTIYISFFPHAHIFRFVCENIENLKKCNGLNLHILSNKADFSSC